MNIRLRTIAAALLTALTPTTLVLGGEELIQYEVQFQATWSSSTHPTSFPSNAHFSPLIGGAHQNGVTFWEPGGLATLGIERMAETGNPSMLQQEVTNAIAAETAESVILGGGTDSPGTVTTTFEVSASHPLVTLVTMIAPSPDWFVGVHGLSLQNNDGLWLPEVVVSLDPYDAGTDSGTNYTSPNANTNPQDTISNIADAFPFNSNGPIGTFTFTRVTPTPCTVADFAEPFSTLDIFDLLAFLDAFNAGNANADLAAPIGTFNIFDLLAFLDEFNAGCAL